MSETLKIEISADSQAALFTALAELAKMGNVSIKIINDDQPQIVRTNLIQMKGQPRWVYDQFAPGQTISQRELMSGFIAKFPTVAHSASTVLSQTLNRLTKRGLLIKNGTTYTRPE